MPGSVDATIAVSIHGPAGVLDLVVPAGATAVDVAREYAQQAEVPGIPLLQTALGQRLNAALPLADAGVQAGDVLVATTGVHRPRKVTLLEAAKNAPESPALGLPHRDGRRPVRRPRRLVRRSRGGGHRPDRGGRGAAGLRARRRAPGRPAPPPARRRGTRLRRGGRLRRDLRARRAPAARDPRRRRHLRRGRGRHRTRALGRGRRDQRGVDRRRPCGLRLLRARRP